MPRRWEDLMRGLVSSKMTGMMKNYSILGFERPKDDEELFHPRI